MSQLLLSGLPSDKIPSHYRDGAPGFPLRMSWMHPLATAALSRWQADCGWQIVLTDAFRSVAASRRRKYPTGKRPRRGVAKPGFSAHNFGLAVDVAVTATLRNLRLSKREFDKYAESFGFYCHRRDHRRAREEWHYNALAIGCLAPEISGRTTAGAVESLIQRLYGKYWAWYTIPDLQRDLACLGWYTGCIDGVRGALTDSAVKKFQNFWFLATDGIVGPQTRRVLWVVRQHRAHESTEKV